MLRHAAPGFLQRKLSLVVASAGFFTFGVALGLAARLGQRFTAPHFPFVRLGRAGSGPPANGSSGLRGKTPRGPLPLLDSEEGFRLLVDNAHDLIYQYRLAPEPGFDYVSPSATAITGYTPEEHYDDPELGVKIVHPDDRRLLEALRQGALPLAEPTELRWIRKDGTIIWTEQRNVPVYDAEGRLVAVQGIARDITKRKNADDELAGYLRFMQVLLDAIPIPVFYKDANGIYRGCNKAFEAYLGQPRDRIVGMTVFDLSPRHLAEIYYKADLDLFREGGVQTYETSVRHADGTEHDVAFYKATFSNPDGTIGGLVGTIVDITERKRVERLREDYLHTISHDLRSPLTDNTRPGAGAEAGAGPEAG